MPARRFAFHETDRQRGAAVDDKKRKIRCPKCGWSPSKHDRWMCACGHSWNTFDTRGICPACDAAWRETQCPSCTAWSLHESWYEDDEST